MMKTQKIYNIIAISLVYFFLEITVYRGVQLIGMQEYWISIPFFLYINYWYMKMKKKEEN